MKTLARQLASATALAVVLVTSHAAGQSAPALPAALDSLYPPAAPGPLYLMKMHEMAMPMSGIVSDAMEGDLDGARANFQAFRQKYSEVAALIPTWQSRFPMEPVEALGAALESGRPESVMPAMGALGGVCNDCHHAFMPLAQHRYHWDDFKRINVSDPLSGQDLPFAQFMHALEGDMTGIAIDARQGQLEQAQKHIQGFRARMTAFKESCMTCHETERHYYVDASIFAAIDTVNAALTAQPPRMETVQAQLMTIGQESCFKCHLVHIPAAYSRH